MEANWEALEASLAARFGGVVEERTGLFRFRSGLHSGFLNGVLRTDVPADRIGSLVAETRAWFPAGLPWRWIVGPTSGPSDLVERLTAEGLERRWPGMPAMAMDLTGVDDRRWIPEGGRVSEVESPSELDAWLSVRRTNLALDDSTIAAWRRAHGESPMGPGSELRHFVGRLKGTPVAGATMFLGAGSAGIYHVDVLAEARGKGFGKAVTMAALEAARALGYRWTVLSASTLGTPVYLRLGFRTVGGVTVLVGAAH
jgi:GNAT superfamily N-acetyltransferase